jgi:hypothetical protein
MARTRVRGRRPARPEGAGPGAHHARRHDVQHLQSRTRPRPMTGPGRTKPRPGHTGRGRGRACKRADPECPRGPSSASSRVQLSLPRCSAMLRGHGGQLPGCTPGSLVSSGISARHSSTSTRRGRRLLPWTPRPFGSSSLLRQSWIAFGARHSSTARRFARTHSETRCGLRRHGVLPPSNEGLRPLQLIGQEYFLR